MSVNTPKRFLEKSEETVAQIDDYVLIDNESLGTRKILTKNLKNHATPNYNWYYNDDRTLVVREKISDGSFRWYFDGFTVQNYTPPWDPVPTNLVSFILNGKLTHCTYQYQGINYAGWIGFWDNTIRIWGEDLTANGSGFVQGAILESSGGSHQNNPWEEPTFDPYNG